MNKPSNVYRISFYNHGTLYELYAKDISQEGILYGFIEVSDLVFGATSGVLVDPSEERLKTEFSGVKRTYIPIHSVLRIDEVEKEGVAKIREIGGKMGSNITPFPIPLYTPTNPPNS